MELGIETGGPSSSARAQASTTAGPHGAQTAEQKPRVSSSLNSKARGNALAATRAAGSLNSDKKC